MTIKVGTTTWAAHALVATGWYPEHVRSAEDKLRYYASQFPLVENQAGYYAVLGREMVDTWAQRTPDDFTMSMKAHALLTGHYSNPRRLPADLQEALPAEVREKRHVYPRDLAPEILREIERRSCDALVPLHDAGKLGVVLLQFPVWFVISDESKAELARLRDVFAPYRVAVEVRNKTWMSDDNREETLAFLADHDLAYTCVDEPQGLTQSVPPIAAATTRDIALLRMHGRNANRWKRARDAQARVQYLYSRAELAEWVPRLLALAEYAREVHVLLNNAYIDYAVRNARDMVELLDEAQRVQVDTAGAALDRA